MQLHRTRVSGCVKRLATLDLWVVGGRAIRPRGLAVCGRRRAMPPCVVGLANPLVQVCRLVMEGGTVVVRGRCSA
jgi:hypothetical protein